MIKKYNQFVKENKTNEEFEMDVPVAMPSRPDVKPGITEKPGTVPSKPSPFRRDKPSTEPGPKAEIPQENWEEDEETGMDKYHSALQSLADAAGVDFDPQSKEVVINGKRVIFPTETEKYHVEGVKKPFNTVGEVISYLESGSEPNKRREVRDEMNSIKDEKFLDNGEQFESISYKSKRFKK
jgi:hypothetical protein